MIRGGANQGCIHPRKPIPGDFNNDGRQDIFVICHGWDAPPFPGEKNQILLSQPNGSYVLKSVGPSGFFHGGAAADMNGDGRLDVILGNGKSKTPLQLWLGNGKGGFRITQQKIPKRYAPYASVFTVELPDVNGDGAFDLVVGGHSWQNAPLRLYLNPGNNNFARAKPITIPDPKGYEVTVDVLAGRDKGRPVLYVLHAGGSATLPTYTGWAVQEFDLGSRTSTVLRAQKGGYWAPWLLGKPSGSDTSLFGFARGRLPAIKG